MKDSLGGTAKTLMFVNVSPSNYNESESKNSMEYATRVKKIKNKVTKNVESINTAILKKTIEDQSIVIQRLKEVVARSNMASEIAALESLLATVNAGIASSGSQAVLKMEEEKEEEF
jgi:Kinesin motor domain